MIADYYFHLHSGAWRTFLSSDGCGRKAASTTAVLDEGAEAIVSAIEERAVKKAANEAESEAIVQRGSCHGVGRANRASTSQGQGESSPRK